MPRLSRLCIKTSFVYLAVGLLVGILLAGQFLWRLPAFVAALYPAYIHLLTVGWLTLLIFGVAWWMFPKYTLERPHGDERLGWAAYFLLNAGLVLRFAVEPLLARGNDPLLAGLLVVSAVLQWLGGMAFILNLWPRVKVK
jgi:hypothetical protein